MTKQETFNKVVKHLRRQKTQALQNDGFGCAYRGDDGKKCAVGCLIPDSLYVPWMEGNEAGEQRMRALLQLLEIDVQLANDLQKVHDNQMNDDYNERTEFALECVALEHGLKMPEIEL